MNALNQALMAGLSEAYDRPQAGALSQLVASLDLFGIPCFAVSDDRRIVASTTAARTHPDAPQIQAWIESPRECVGFQGTSYSEIVRKAYSGGWHTGLIRTRAGELAVAVGPCTVAPCPGVYLVVPSQSDEAQATRLAAIQRLYSLSEAEMSVLSNLVSGMKPKQISVERNVSQNTVRTQIRTILGKTRSRSVNDLLVHIAQLPPVFGPACSERAEEPWRAN